jgi:hypothetical protein
MEILAPAPNRGFRTRGPLGCFAKGEDLSAVEGDEDFRFIMHGDPPG